LRQWADQTGSKDPFVWIFTKDGKRKRRDKVKNVLFTKDMYTLRIKGQKNYLIEETFAQVFQQKISQQHPLSEEEHIVLCAFVSAMMQRTLRTRRTSRRFMMT
jgi:helix-turn-helix protein